MASSHAETSDSFRPLRSKSAEARQSIWWSDQTTGRALGKVSGYFGSSDILALVCFLILLLGRFRILLSYVTIDDPPDHSGVRF